MACGDGGVCGYAVPVGVRFWRGADCGSTAYSVDWPESRGAGCGAGVYYDCRGGGGAGLAEDSFQQRGMAGGLLAVGYSGGVVAADEQSSKGGEDCAGDFYRGLLVVFVAWPQAA